MQVDVFLRFQKFVKSLLKSPSYETRFLANILRTEPNSQLGGNIRYIQQLSGLDVTTTSREKLRQELSEKTELTDDEMQVVDWLNELIGYKVEELKSEVSLRVRRPHWIC